MESTIKHQVTLDAEVNAPAQVRLFDVNGKVVIVSVADEPYWLSQGFAREKLDAPSALAEFHATLKAMDEAVDAYVLDATTKGVIEHAVDSAHMAAYVAIMEFEKAWHKLQRVVDHTLPNAEADAVELRQDDKTIRVDPGQVELYKAQGWQEAK